MGISPPTLNRARKDLGIVARKEEKANPRTLLRIPDPYDDDFED